MKMAEEGQQLIQLELNGENVLVAVDKDGTAQTVDEASLTAGDMVLQTMIENVQPGEAELLAQPETETEMEVEEPQEKVVTTLSEEKSEFYEVAEKIASLPSEVIQRIWNCTILTLIETLTSPDACKRSGLLPGDLIAVISVWKSGDKRCYLLANAKHTQKMATSFVSISPPNPAALYAASCENVNVFVLSSVLSKYQEGSVLFDKNCLMAFSQMWYFIHFALVFYMRGGTVKMLYSEFKKDKYLSRTAILMDRLAKETSRDLPQIILTQYQKRFPHQFCDFLQGYFQMLVEPNRPFLNTHDELSVEDLLRILKMCKISTTDISGDGSGTPSRNDVMQVLFNATPAALQKVSTCFELTLQQMRQNNLRDFWLKLGTKHSTGMKDVLTRLADRLDLDYAQIISRQCKELKSTFAADLICRLLRQSKHLTTDMFHDKPATPNDESDDTDNGLGRALIIDMVTRQTKLIVPGRCMETIPMESRDDAGEANETEVVVRGDVIGKIITLSQESGPDKDRLELMSHNCRKYDLLIIRDSGGIKKMSYTGNPGWEVTSEFSPSEAMFVFLRELLMSPIKIMQTDPIVVDITMCYRLLKHLKSEDESEDSFLECDQSQISEPVLTLVNGNENVTILIRCCSCVALTEFVEYLQRLARQDSLDLSHATTLVKKGTATDPKEALYQDMDVASHVEILNAKQGKSGDLEAVEQSVISYLDENARLKSTECRKYVRQPKANFGLSLLANCIEMNPDQGGKSNVMKVKGLSRSGGEKEPEMEILQRGKGSQTPTVVKVTGVNKAELPSSVVVEELLNAGDLQAEHSSGKRASVVWIPVMVNQFQQSEDGNGNSSGGEGQDPERKREIMIGIINEDDDSAQQAAVGDSLLTQEEGVENVVAWQLVDVDSAISQQTPGVEVTIGQAGSSNVASRLNNLNQVQKDQQSMIENMSLWSTVGSPGCTPGGKRDRFPDWLIKQVDYGGIEGLQWVDKSQNVIRMPWKHASSSMWSMDDVELMRRWAVHTGKFAPSLTPNSMNNMPKNWKVNFRMSLNLYAQKMAKTRDSLICRIFNKPIKRVGKPIKLDI